MQKIEMQEKKPKYTFEMLIEAQLETEKLIKTMSIEADKRMKEMSAEADKRQVETAKQMKEMSAEADKRQVETAKQMKEMSAEADRKIKEMSAETDRKIKEISVEADKRMKELGEKLEKTSAAVLKTSVEVLRVNQTVNGIANSNGLVAEQAIYNALERDMTYAGINFYDIEQNVKKHRKVLNLKGEYDIILTNTDTLGIIETKYKVTKEDVIKLATKQLDNFRILFPLYKDYKIVLGVGGMSFEDGAEYEALSRGIGIIKVIGDKVEYYTDNIKKY